MSETNLSHDPDEVAAILGDFAAHAPGTLDARATRAAKAALIDALAVSMGALTHQAAQAARRHAYRFATPDGCVLWGSSKRAAPELAALTNGVLLRCYDYNDFFVGQRNSGHPSDMVAAVVAAAEWADADGAKLLTALALGYEVVAAAFDTFSTAPGGWDYTNLVSLGATCAVARVLGLDAAQAREALAMTVVPHFASDEIESGELNARGDLTMWKRFNGSDAARNALQACLLAQVGVEGAVRPFVGKQGFIRKLANKSEDTIPVLKDRLAAKRPLTRIAETNMKRWPVGSLAQSAIQAALAARTQVADIGRIKQVRVFAEEGAYDHLVKIRQAPYAPISRETADHSLPYIVAAAVLDGVVTTASFAPSRVLDPARQRFVADKVKAAPEAALGTIAGGKHKRHAMGYLGRVEIETDDGKVVRGDAKPFPGHPTNPLSDEDLAGKLKENMEPFAGPERTAKLARCLGAVETLRSVREMTALLALPETSGVDSAKAE
jgi:2-methylcitrate dehydratase